MGPGHARAQVDAGEHVAVVGAGTQTVAPGVAGVEAVALALVRVGGVERGAHAGHAELAGTVDRVAAEAQLAGIVLEAADVVVADLADQGQAAGTEHPVDELDRGDLRLGEGLALVAMDSGAADVVGLAAFEYRVER